MQINKEKNCLLYYKKYQIIKRLNINLNKEMILLKLQNKI